MPSRRSDRHRRFRCLGVALLILGVANVPGPRADFHNIRHHDGPGESCPLHEHLRSWHPGAGAAQDVAVLHWHWTPPAAPRTDSGDVPTARTQAHDWPGGCFDDAPQLAPPEATGWADLAPPGDLDSSIPLAPEVLAAAMAARAGPGALRAVHAALTSRVPLTVRLQRWAC